MHMHNILYIHVCSGRGFIYGTSMKLFWGIKTTEKMDAHRKKSIRVQRTVVYVVQLCWLFFKKKERKKFS